MGLTYFGAAAPRVRPAFRIAAAMIAAAA
jgi:hypothetical protein